MLHTPAAGMTSAAAPSRARAGSAAAFVDEIYRIELYPFVMVRIGRDSSSAAFVYCENQNFVPEFVDAIARVPRFAESLLVRGIEQALRQETYEAGDLLYRWVRSGGAIGETAYILPPDGRRIEPLYNFPVFALGCADSPADSDERVRMLLNILKKYAASDGNNKLRFSIIEALALALGRAFGARKDFHQALSAVEIGLGVEPYSIHLKAAKHTLLLKSQGKSVAPRMEKFAGDDNGYLKQFVCHAPFERFDIGPNGDVKLCCGHWLPTSIGNFLSEHVPDILNSPKAKAIRASIMDGSYKYCNHIECTLMTNQVLPDRNAADSQRARKAVAEQNMEVDGIGELMFAFDETCNLSCPSCRTHVITEKFSQSVDKARSIEEKLVPLLSKVHILHINPAGELFASKPSRRLLELINDERCPDLKLDIISNGTLFSREEWNKFPGIHNKVRSIRISIDAACKDTFEKLRRLGKYENFLENIRFLRELRRSQIVLQLYFSFTYQVDNFREMRAFIAFAEEMGADLTVFERLKNRVFSEDEFRHKAVHDLGHPLHREFIGVINDPIFRGWNVWHDFDYDGVQNLGADEALGRIRAWDNQTTITGYFGSNS